MSRPKVVACILVRMASTRLPGKPLIAIAEKPMTLRLIERLRLSTMIDEIAVCTTTRQDDRILLDHAARWGVTGIAGDEEDIVSRITAAANHTSADIVLRVTGDNVFTDPENIDRMVQAHVTSGVDYTRTRRLPLGVTAEVMSTGMLPRLRDALPDASASEYLMLYAFDPQRFRCKVLDAPADCQRSHYSITVDTMKDVESVSSLFSCVDDVGPIGAELIRRMDLNPELWTIPGATSIKMPGGEAMAFAELLHLLDKRAEMANELEAARAAAA